MRVNENSKQNDKQNECAAVLGGRSKLNDFSVRLGRNVFRFKASRNGTEQKVSVSAPNAWLNVQSAEASRYGLILQYKKKRIRQWTGGHSLSVNKKRQGCKKLKKKNGRGIIRAGIHESSPSKPMMVSLIGYREAQVVLRYPEGQIWFVTLVSIGETHELTGYVHES